MSLLAVLLTVVLQYFAEQGDFLAIPDNWIAGYWRLIGRRITNVGWQIGLVLAVVPVLLGLLLAQLISAYLLHGLLDLAIVLVVLLVTLRVRNYDHMLAVYSQALTEQNWQDGSEIISRLTGKIPPEGFSQANRQLSRWVSIDLFRNWFVGLFWFGILGIHGAATYWLWRKLAVEMTKHGDQCDQNYLEGLHRYLYWAEYLPVRLWTAGYALVGEFVPTFDWLMEELWGGLSSEQMIERGSLLALGATILGAKEDDDDSVPISEEVGELSADNGSLLELQQIVRLNKRLFIIWFVLLVISGLWAILM